jgi:hypothetical protein
MEAPASPPKRKLLPLLLMGLGGLFVLIQAVPYGRSHENPPVVQEPAWDSPATRALAVRACFDCHSNQSVWPWYSNVAPVSWFVQQHVNEGRETLNFSELQRPQKRAHKAGEEVEEGGMPLTSYLLLHSEAKLSTAERTALVSGLKATFPGGGGQRESSEEKKRDD